MFRSRIWDYKKVPSFGDSVIISSGTVVTYDVHSTNAIGNLKIDGKLIFSRNKSTSLDVGNTDLFNPEIGNSQDKICHLSRQNGPIRGETEINGATIS